MYCIFPIVRLDLLPWIHPLSLYEVQYKVRSNMHVSVGESGLQLDRTMDVYGIYVG